MTSTRRDATRVGLAAPPELGSGSLRSREWSWQRQSRPPRVGAGLNGGTERVGEETSALTEEVKS